MYSIANHGSTVHRQECMIMIKVQSNCWMKMTRGHVKYRRKKVGEDIYIQQIQSHWQEQRKPVKIMEPENSNQKLIIKYPAPKARKRLGDVTKTIKKSRLEVAGKSPKARNRLGDVAETI